MGLEKLTVEQKQELLKAATRFEISDDISVALRGNKRDQYADRWAITRCGSCYKRSSDEWILEPLSSHRDAVFMRSTRYPLHTALEIVNSPQFKGKYLE